MIDPTAQGDGTATWSAEIFGPRAELPFAGARPSWSVGDASPTRAVRSPHR